MMVACVMVIVIWKKIRIQIYKNTESSSVLQKDSKLVLKSPCVVVVIEGLGDEINEFNEINHDWDQYDIDLNVEINIIVRVP